MPQHPCLFRLVLACVTALAGAAPRPAAAQVTEPATIPGACAEVVPGDHVTFRTTDPQRRWRATFIHYDGARLVVDDRGMREVFPAGSVLDLRVECQLAPGDGAGVGSGFSTGVLVGGLAGVGLIAVEPDPLLGAPMLIIGGGALVGGLIGALVGSRGGDERDWVPWDLAAGADPGPGIAIRMSPAPLHRDAWSVGVRLSLPRRP